MALLATAAGDDSPIVMMEIRHVAGAPSGRDGAVVAPPGDFIYHAVAPLGRSSHEQIDAGFVRAREVWSPADAGSTPGSWVEGAATVADALPAHIRDRARAIADAVDPQRRFRRSRLLG